MTIRVRPGFRPGHERPVSDVRDRHGGRMIANGVTAAAGALVLSLFWRFVVQLDQYPPDRAPVAAWIAFVVILAVGVLSRLLTPRPPTWLYVILLAALAAPVSIDLIFTWQLLPLGIIPTAAPAAGLLLMPIVVLYSPRPPLIVAGVIGTALLAHSLSQAPTAGGNLFAGLTAALTAFFPAYLCAVIATEFVAMVRRELDLTRVQSTTATPETAVGMAASEELVRLDRDAETLLDSVGSGATPLPVPAAVAARAGEIAGALRVRLIEGRNDTWLRHAVSESRYLADRVIVTDLAGSAVRLNAEQRDGLLLALWWLSGEASRKAIEVDVTVGVPDEDQLQLEVTLVITGLTRNRLDAAVIDALDRVGRFRVTPSKAATRIAVVAAISADPASLRYGDLQRSTDV
ncbi:MAG TPA: hypothetical protein VFU07_03325 [Candidatus Lumbricidophila sp.]|nr:hypothetical protein [Candidatus Lumbricidophila sp.]